MRGDPARAFLILARLQNRRPPQSDLIKAAALSAQTRTAGRTEDNHGSSDKHWQYSCSCGILIKTGWGVPLQKRS